jgi:hypothetical protein
MKQRLTALLLTLGLAVIFVPALRIEADWLVVTLHDTQDAYASYAAAWPGGPHSVEARAREDDRAWQAAESIGTIAAYHGYLQDHAHGTYAPTAHARIDDLTWAGALST